MDKQLSPEKQAQLTMFVKLFIIGIFAGLYAWGGIEYKWLRRFVAPTILCLSMVYFTRDWKAIYQLPLMCITLSFGYGGDVLIEKIFRRGLFGLVNGASSSTYNIMRKKWLLVGIQVVLMIGLYIMIGVFNPFPNARTEETFFGVIIPIIPLLGAGLKKG